MRQAVRSLLNPRRRLVLPVKQYQPERSNRNHPSGNLLPVFLPKNLKVELIGYS
jgi:hypothetical protein